MLRVIETVKITDDIFHFLVEAPIYWWVDFPYIKYGFDLTSYTDEERKSLPVCSMVKAHINLTKQEIVDICVEWFNGCFAYNHKAYEWNDETEWNIFCQDLLRLENIKELVKEKM